jgi:hypothetical protein
MKFIPTNKREWLSLAAVPFKAYFIGVALIYPYWRSRMPGRPGMIGGDDVAEGIALLELGFYISFAALLAIAYQQRAAGYRWAALFNTIFALVALYGFVVWHYIFRH